MSSSTRRKVGIAAALACACAPIADVAVDVPAGALVTVFVIFDAFGTVTAVEGYAANETVSRSSLGGSVTAVLQYDRSFEAMGIRREGAQVIWTAERDEDVSTPLEMPVQWIEIASGAQQILPLEPAAFTARFVGVGIPRAPCLKLDPQRTTTQHLFRDTGPISFVAPLGEGRVVVGTQANEPVTTFASVNLLTDDTVTTLVVSSTRTTPRGFVLENGHVWYAFYSGPEPSPLQLCELTPEAPTTPRCAPTTRGDGALTTLTVSQIVGQLVDGHMEALMLTIDGALWYHREGEPWQRIEAPAEVADCNVGFPALALAYTGEREAVVGFKNGPIQRLKLGPEGLIAREELFERDDFGGLQCRSAYARFADGSEVVLLKRAGGLVGSQVEGRWRRDREGPWLQLPIGGGLSTHALEPYAGQLIASGSAFDVRVIDRDPTRPELPPRFCPPYVVGSEVIQIAPAGARLYFGSETRAGGLVSWTEPL